MIGNSDPQKRLGIKNCNTERSVCQNRCRKQIPLHKDGHQQRIGPKHKARYKPETHAGTVDVFKIDRRQNSRAELRHRRKGQVIVSCVAVSTMVCNDLVMPLLLRSERLQKR